jgi:hypothetical protein
MTLKRKSAWVVRLALVSVCFLAAILLLVPRNTKTHAQSHSPVHMTTDWSNRYMIFSEPSSMAQGWRLQAGPRYLQQWTRRNATAAQAQGAR